MEEIWPFEEKTNFKYLNKDRINERIYKTLLYEILSGEFKSGDEILINKLTQRYEVSTTPIREALYKLKNEGILVKAPYKSYMVKKFSIKEIKNLYEARKILETQAIKLASRRIEEKEKKQFEEILNNGIAFIEDEDYGSFNKNNAKFHFYIFETSKNDYLFKMMDDIYKQIMLLTFKSFSITKRPEVSVEEHKEIYRNLVEGREKEAMNLMANHLDKSLSQITKVFEEENY